MKNYASAKQQRYHGILTFMVFGCSAVSFSFFLYLELTRSGTNLITIRRDCLRIPIAAAVVIQYLGVVSIAAFFHPDDTPHDMFITREMSSSFTYVMLMVVGFYFGFSSLDKIVERQRKANDDDIRPAVPH